MKNKLIPSFKIESIKDVCNKILPLNGGWVLFGMSSDNPILYNVWDIKTPNTVIWDASEGQGINIIKTAIEFILKYKTGGRMEFLVISDNTHEWDALGRSGLGVWSESECIAIVPFKHGITKQVFDALGLWLKNRDARYPILIFLDGIECLDTLAEDVKENIRYVLSKGRQKSVYVVGTAKYENRENLSRWLDFFQSEIYGMNEPRWFEMDKAHKNIVFFAPITTI